MSSPSQGPSKKDKTAEAITKMGEAEIEVLFREHLRTAHLPDFVKDEMRAMSLADKKKILSSHHGARGATLQLDDTKRLLSAVQESDVDREDAMALRVLLTSKTKDELTAMVQDGALIEALVDRVRERHEVGQQAYPSHDNAMILRECLRCLRVLARQVPDAVVAKRPDVVKEASWGLRVPSPRTKLASAEVMARLLEGDTAAMADPVREALYDQAAEVGSRSLFGPMAAPGGITKSGRIMDNVNAKGTGAPPRIAVKTGPTLTVPGTASGGDCDDAPGLPPINPYRVLVEALLEGIPNDTQLGCHVAVRDPESGEPTYPLRSSSEHNSSGSAPASPGDSDDDSHGAGGADSTGSSLQNSGLGAPVPVPFQPAGSSSGAGSPVGSSPSTTPPVSGGRAKPGELRLRLSEVQHGVGKSLSLSGRRTGGELAHSGRRALGNSGGRTARDTARQAVSVRTSVLELINVLIGAQSDVAARVALRQQMMEAGLCTALMAVRVVTTDSDVHDQLDAFDEAMTADSTELAAKTHASRVLKAGMGLGAQKHPHVAGVVVSSWLAQLRRPVFVPIADPTITKVRECLAAVEAAVPWLPASEYDHALYRMAKKGGKDKGKGKGKGKGSGKDGEAAADGGDGSDGKDDAGGDDPVKNLPKGKPSERLDEIDTDALDLDKTFAEQGLEGKVLLELRPCVARVRMRLEGMHETRPVPVRTDRCVDDVLVRVVKSFGMGDPDNYVLFVLGAGSGESRSRIEMPRKARLVSYRYLIAEHQVELQLKPVPLKVRFFNAISSFSTLRFHPKLPIAQVLMGVAQHAGVATDQVPKYGLFVECDNGPPYWMEEKNQLRAYSLEDRDFVRLMLRPRKFNVQMPNGDEAMTEVDTVKSTSEVMKSLMQNSRDHRKLDLSLFAVDGNRTVELDMMMSPSRQGVLTPNTRFVLAKKGTLKSGLRSVTMASEETVWTESSAATLRYSEVAVVDGARGTISKGASGTVRRKKVIEAGTLEQLVQHLTSLTDYDPDFLNTFLTTFQSFCTPAELLGKLIERYRAPESVPEADRRLVGMRVFLVLKKWLEDWLHDMGPDLVRRLLEFADGEMADQGYANKLRSVVEGGRKGGVSSTWSEPPKPKVPKGMPDKWRLADMDTRELARQMTLQVQAPFLRIRPPEFFGQAWSNPKLQENSPNLLAVIDVFNTVSQWASTAILVPDKASERAVVFERLIKVCEALMGMNNFHLAIAMLGGFNNSAVGRLKFTKEKMSKKSRQALASMEELMSMEGSFKLYREALREAPLPVLPYMGVYLSDLTFIEDGNSDTLSPRVVGDPPLINMTKRFQIFDVVQQVANFQSVPYNLLPVSPVAEWLAMQPRHDDESLYTRSLVVEPRGVTKVK